MKTVLVAEDNQAILDLVVSRLKVAGHTVHAVTDGEEAHRFLRGTLEFDVVISDKEMPGMDGIELYRRIRGSVELVHRRETPFVLFTGNLTAEDSAVIAGDERAFVLAKPARLKELIELLA